MATKRFESGEAITLVGTFTHLVFDAAGVPSYVAYNPTSPMMEVTDPTGSVATYTSVTSPSFHRSSVNNDGSTFITGQYQVTIIGTPGHWYYTPRDPDATTPGHEKAHLWVDADPT